MMMMTSSRVVPILYPVWLSSTQACVHITTLVLYIYMVYRNISISGPHLLENATRSRTISSLSYFPIRRRCQLPKTHQS